MSPFYITGRFLLTDLFAFCYQYNISEGVVQEINKSLYISILVFLYLDGGYIIKVLVSKKRIFFRNNFFN